VVGAVLPWNFPAAMLAWKIAPALAAGNSVVVKPPELASLTTLRIAELASQAGVPAGVLDVVPGLGHVAPFGGYKTSGFGGRDNGLEALEQYAQVKTIWLTIR